MDIDFEKIQELAEHTKEIALVEKAKLDYLNTHFPTWTQVSIAVDNISNLAEAKVFPKKLARITYWLARNKKD